jgi:tetratricopeptide (TPR) repeat protein
MHFNYSRCLLALLLSPFALSSSLQGQPGFDQMQNQRFEIPLSGQLEGGSVDYSRLRVQLWDQGRRNSLAETQVGLMGGFEFSAVPSGTYELRVVNWQGDPIHSEGVSVPNSGVLVLKLRGSAGPQARIPISLTRLQHKVPKKAHKAFVDARKSLIRGDRPKAMALFETAIRVDPQFFEAANDLGVMYLTDGRLSEAFEMFQRATTLDQGDPLAEANLAYVLLAMHRFPEAEEAARSSIRADSLSSRARYLLAVSLLEQRKSTKEVLFHLTQAKEQFEPARKLLIRLETEGVR